MSQLPILKKNVHRTITRIDSVNFTHTANVNFLTKGLTFNGNGSEIYEYEFIMTAQSTSDIFMVFNSITSYSEDYMQGRATTPSANVTSTVTAIPVLQCSNVTYPPLIKIKVTGRIGNKRHVQIFKSFEDGATGVMIASYYINDTSTELTTVSFFSSATGNTTISMVGDAVPHIQYNPNAILLHNEDLVNQTADIVWSNLDGEKYGYVVKSSGLTRTQNSVALYLNEITTNTNIVRQRLLNSSGSLLSSNSTTGTRDCFIQSSDEIFISADTGRKKITITSGNNPNGANQYIDYQTNQDTSTLLSSILLRPAESISGNIQLYAVPKGKNADLTPWDFRQVHTVSNASFAGGKAFDIKPNAMFARIQIKGYSASGSNINLDFDATTSLSKQYLKSLGSVTTANFSTNRTIGKIDAVSNIDCIIALKSGANRPILSKSNYNENTIDINGLWALNSSTVYNQIILNADNSNLMDCEIAVSYI